MAGIDEFITPEEMKVLARIKKKHLWEIIQCKADEYNKSLNELGEPDLKAANYLRYLIKYEEKPDIDLDQLKEEFTFKPNKDFGQ